MRYIKKYTVKEWKNFDNNFTIGVCNWCEFESVTPDDMGSHFEHTDHTFTWETRNIQEVMCKKYDIILTDWKTSGEKRKLVMQKITHILWLMLLQSFQALKAYNNQPKKRKRKR